MADVRIIQVLLVILGTYFGVVSSQCGSFSGWDDYMSSWRRTHSSMSSRLYPFGDYYCDTNATNEQRYVGFNPNIDFPIPFYGRLHHSIFISVHGHVAFFQTKTPNRTHYIFLDSWPNPQYPEPNHYDFAFAAPFYSQTDFDPFTPSETSQLTYRVWTRPSEIGGNPDLEIKQRLIDSISDELQESVIGAEYFQAQRVIIITWSGVSFYGTTCVRDPYDTCSRNTYQMVLATDGESTYIMFNYADIKWVGGSAKQLCDPQTGTSSVSHPSCHPAHAGFNAGDGRGFTPMPYSGEKGVADYDILRGGNIIGRWVFDVTGDVIIRGGCTNDTSLIDIWNLAIHPAYGPMLGGSQINLAGPCFNSGNRIKCRFGNVETDGMWDGNTMKATCIQPTLGTLGMITLWVSVNGGGLYQYSTDYQVGLMGRTQPVIRISNPSHDWLTPSTLTLTWTPGDIAQEQATVSVRLWGYREFGNTLQMDYRLLDTLASGISNSGAYTVTPEANQCDHPEEPALCTDFDVGMFEVVRYQESYGHTQAVWSQPFPLGWYNHAALEGRYPGGWLQGKCQDWINMDKRNGGWVDYTKLEPCPCKLHQAYADFGRFQADTHCNIDTPGDDQCLRHKGAVHCVRSTQVTSQQGSGNQCCYDSDGDLMYAGDSMYGSTSDRAHDWGKSPYGQPGKVPTMSHYVWDVVPWFFCCEWQPDSPDCFDKYLVHRPTIDCKDYRLPGHASTFGDPHFLTFDGSFYTFNGHGEYWLLHAQNVQLPEQTISFFMQGRFQQPTTNLSWEATHMTAVALQQNSASIITFAVNLLDPEQRRLYVHVDGRLLEFSDHGAYWQEFEDFIIQNNDPEGSKLHSNFTVIYRAGMGVNLAYANGLIQVLVVLPYQFMGKTGGLFGLWNGDGGDDLRPRQGGPPIDPTNTELLHYNFGETWVAESGETMFTSLYRSQLRYTYYRKPGFLPAFRPTFPPGAGIGDGDVDAVCHGDAACTFDYKVTLDVAVARHTLDMQARDEELRAMNVKVLSCGWPDMPNVLKEEPISYYPGSVITIKGCRHGYILEGPTTYSCVGEGDLAYWDPTPSTVCLEPEGGMSPALITAIAVPSAIAFLLIVMGIIVLTVHCRRKKRKRDQYKEKNTNDLPLETQHTYPTGAVILPSETKHDPYVTYDNNGEPNRISTTSDDIRKQRVNLDDSISVEDTTLSFDSGQKRKKSSVSDPSDVEVTTAKTKVQPLQPSTVVLGSSGVPQQKSTRKARAPLHKRSADPLPSPPPTPNPNRGSMPQLIHASATGNVIYTPSGGRKLNPQMPFQNVNVAVSDSSGPDMASSPRLQSKKPKKPKSKHSAGDLANAYSADAVYPSQSSQHKKPKPYATLDTAFYPDQDPLRPSHGYPEQDPRKPPYVYPVSAHPEGGPVARKPPYVYPRAGHDSRVEGSPASSYSGRRYDGYR